jgi:hypothetical protein
MSRCVWTELELYGRSWSCGCECVRCEGRTTRSGWCCCTELHTRTARLSSSAPMGMGSETSAAAPPPAAAPEPLWTSAAPPPPTPADRLPSHREHGATTERLRATVPRPAASATGAPAAYAINDEAARIATTLRGGLDPRLALHLTSVPTHTLPRAAHYPLLSSPSLLSSSPTVGTHPPPLLVSIHVNMRSAELKSTGMQRLEQQRHRIRRSAKQARHTHRRNFVSKH